MRKLFILLSVLCMTMLTGCVEMDFTVDIEKDGSGKMIVEMLGESYMMSEVDTSEDISMMSMVGKSIPFNFHVKSPIKFEESNATSVQEVYGETVYN